MSPTWVTLFIVTVFIQKIYTCRYEYLTHDSDYYDDSVEEEGVIIKCAHVSLSNLTEALSVFGKRKEYLQIVKSNITTIPDLAFQRYPNLIGLNLDEAGVRNILPGAFNNLSNLEQLHINNNPLDEIGDNTFIGLNALKILDLSNNQISRLNRRSLFGLEKLEKLYLKNNKIEVIVSDFLSGKSVLKVLDLSGNPLIKTDIELPNQSLSLNLTNTSLIQENLSFSVASFDRFDWSHCHLFEINFQKFPKVKVLNISHNKLLSMHNLESLIVENLNLGHNRLETIDRFSSSVKKVNLTHNNLQVLELHFNGSSSLSTLDVSFNKISKIQKYTFQQLASLEELILSHNNITNFEPIVFRNLTNLTVLDLSHNSIDKFQYGTFDTLTKLVTLDLSHNKLTELHQYTLHSLANLRNLYFDNNQISFFNVEDLRRHLRHLEMMSLDGNKFSCQSLVTIQQYLNIWDIKIVKGSSYDVDNFHGVACINNKDYEFGLSSMVLQKIINESVHHSKMEAFFNREFNKSKFAQYFEKGYSESKFFKSLNDQTSDNKALMISSVVQIILSCILVFVIVYVFIYLRRMIVAHKSTLLTQIEL